MWLVGLLCASGLLALAAVLIGELIAGSTRPQSIVDVILPVITVAAMTVLVALASYTAVSW